MDNEWKNSLRERFSDYAAPEPEGLWEGIEQGIAGKPRSKMLPVWLVSGAAVAAAVALVVFLHPEKALESPDLQKQGTLAESVQADVAGDVPVAEPVEAPVAQPVEAPVAKSVPFAVVSRHTLLSEAEPAVSVPVSEETVPDAVHEIVPIEEVPVNQEEEKEMPDQVGQDLKAGQEEKVEAEQTVEEALRNKVPSLEITPAASAPNRKRFSIGAYHEGGGEASLETSRGIGLVRTGDYLTRSMPGSDVKGGTSQAKNTMMNMLSSNRESTYQATHRAPVRVGVTASWQMTNHLSLVSGLTWTALTSHFNESTEGDTRMAGTQDLGYLGVPLRLEAGWEPVKRLRLYANAGGMVEKGLLATVNADSYLGGVESTNLTSHPDMGGLLWSVGAEAGAEYRLGKAFGVYFAPGVEYHFDNGAEVRSAYTEKPLHWNLDLGVRFHFGN